MEVVIVGLRMPVHKGCGIWHRLWVTNTKFCDVIHASVNSRR
jgi:hypothetical protein